MKYLAFLMAATSVFWAAGTAFAADPAPGAITPATGAEAALWSSEHKDRVAVRDYYSGQAIKVLQRTEGTSGSVRSLYLRGRALQDLGRWEQASDSYRDALSAASRPGQWYQRSLLAYLSLMPYLTREPDPEVPAGYDRDLGGQAAVSLANYLYSRGDEKRAESLLSGASRSDRDSGIYAGLALARQSAVAGKWKRSAAILVDLKPETGTPLAHFVSLVRGRHLMEAGRYAQARDSFLAVPPDSPYAPDALQGHAWALIRQGDLSGGAVRLEELTRSFPASPAARTGVLDLALCYRELSLFKQAGDLLAREDRRLSEYANWAGSLDMRDMFPGQAVGDLIDFLMHGQPVPRELLDKTPPHVKSWAESAVADPYVRRSTGLLDALEKVSGLTRGASQHFAGSAELTASEIRWTRRDMEANRARVARLTGIKERLPRLSADLYRSLGTYSLDRFSTEKSLSLISRIRDSRIRLEVMENTVSKAERFSPLIESLSAAKTGSKEEAQLNRIRERAYKGLVSSRDTLGRYRSTLLRLEGRVWLSLKGKAVDLEHSMTGRVEQAGRAIEHSLKAARRTEELLKERKGALQGLQARIKEASRYLETDLTGRIDKLRNRAYEARAQRLVRLARAAAIDFKETRARALFTAADIETARMTKNLEAMQEGSR